MAYHEVRIVKGKKLNYLVHNRREGSKWVKKSRFIGTGSIPKEKLALLKNDFEINLFSDRKYAYLSTEQVVEIGTLKKKYQQKISALAKEEYEKFEKSFFTELTYNSNAIEGSSLTLQETSLILNENLAPEGKSTSEIYEAKKHREALRFIKEHKGGLDEKLILRLHSIILKDISENFAGRYRQTSVRIFGSDVKFPDSEKVPQLVKNLVYWYKNNKSKYHQFELAVLVSMKFVTIHPFVDGNGRVSRLLMNLLLNKGNYPWINIYNKQRAKYLLAVRKANDENYYFIFPFLIATLKENLKDLGIA